MRGTNFAKINNLEIRQHPVVLNPVISLPLAFSLYELAFTSRNKVERRRHIYSIIGYHRQHGPFARL